MAVFSEIGDLVLWRMVGVMFGLWFRSGVYIIIDVYYLFPMCFFWIFLTFLYVYYLPKERQYYAAHLHSKPFYINWRKCQIDGIYAAFPASPSGLENYPMQTFHF